MEKSGLSRNEWIILTLSIGTAAVVLAVLLLHLSWWGDRHGEVVAIVIENHRDVRYRSSDEFVWNSSRTKMNVINRDQFFVGDKSALKIMTIEGETLEFSENSLVVIRLQDGKVEADLLLGDAKATKLKPGKYGSGGSGALAAAAPKEETLSLRQPPPPTPTPAPVQEYAPVAYAPKLKWTAVENISAEVDPVTATELLKGAENKVRISWAPSQKADPVRVTIKDLQGRVVKLLRTNENEIEWQGAKAGSYQAFVERYEKSSRKPSSAYTGSGAFEIPELKRIPLGQPVFPKPNQTILKSSEGFSLPIQTRPSVGAIATQVEFSRQANFSQVEFRAVFEGNNFVLREPLEEGIWFFRTRSVGEYSISNWSRPSRFQLLEP